nr:hypothetical protein [Tanacetum cinerariifolium]
MPSLFADTHNVVAILEKSDAAEGFDQIIDFLSGSYIYYALTVNPHIYISCIKQFWNTASVKCSGDVIRLQALVDKKKILISEAVIHEILQLDDAEGVVCLPNEEIFSGLAQMGYEKLSTKLTFYKAFFSKDVEEHVAKDVSHCAIPLPPSHDISPPTQEPSLPHQQPYLTPPAPTQDEALPANFQQVLDTCSTLIRRVEHLERSGRVVTTAKLITEVVTVAASQVSAASTTISTASATIPAAKPSIPVAAPTVVAAYIRRRKGVIIIDPEEELPLKTSAETPKVNDKGKGILVESPKPMKKKDQIELDTEYARKLHDEINKDDAEFNKDIDWDAAMDHVNQQSSKNPQYIKRYHGMKKKPQTKSEAHKNMMIYLKNIVGYKMDFFKGMLKLNEEAQEAEALKKQLEIVNDEVDDVFIEATPLGRKTMFEKSDGQDAVWRNQNTVYGQALGADFPAHFQQVLDTCAALIRRVEHLEHDNVAQKLEIVKLQARVKKLEKSNKVKSSKFRRLRKVRASRRVESSDDMEDVFNQGRMINEGSSFKGFDAVSATIPAAKPSIPAAALTVVAAYTRRRKGVVIRDPEEELSSKTPAETPGLKDKGKGILVESPKPMKKKDQIKLDAEYARKLHEEINKDHKEFNKDIDWDAAMDHVNQKSSKNPQYIKRYHGMKKKPQTKVNDEDDDVFTEATSLGRKVPVVDYEIVMINKKPRYKIIRADDTH